LHDRAEYRPVIIGEHWPVDLSVQHSQPVAQDDGLKVTGASGADGELCQ
jgi:hypothetical protein